RMGARRGRRSRRMRTRARARPGRDGRRDVLRSRGGPRWQLSSTASTIGSGQPLSLTFVVLVDDTIESSDWEQELYRMGAPPEIEVKFESVESALQNLASYQARPDRGILLTGDIETMRQLVDRSGA